MFETILAPLDGSTLAIQSLPYVTELATNFNARVTLLGVCEPEETDQGEACRNNINHEAIALERILAPEGASINTVVSTGAPHQQIIDYAENNKIGLIILTSHGRSGIAPWSLGSTVQKILQLPSTIPILLIKSKDPPEQYNRLFERIIVPLDGAEHSETAIPYIVELAKKFESEVILFRVIEEGKHVHTIGGLQYIPYLDQNIQTSKAKAEEYLNEIRARFQGTKAKLSSEIVTGDAAREILKISEKQDYCLIAMSSHGHTGIEAWTFGSVTYKIIQSAKKPLLLVRAGVKQ